MLTTIPIKLTTILQYRHMKHLTVSGQWVLYFRELNFNCSVPCFESCCEKRKMNKINRVIIWNIRYFLSTGSVFLCTTDFFFLTPTNNYCYYFLFQTLKNKVCRCIKRAINKIDMANWIYTAERQYLAYKVCLHAYALPSQFLHYWSYSNNTFIVHIVLTFSLINFVFPFSFVNMVSHK
jgi:hypothetical protein